MVTARLALEKEVQDIFQCIDNNQNFLLSGGAGSGKTYCLVQVIRQAIAENPTAKVACMTYTNAAAQEIRERVNHKNLTVSTIHDFLWSSIKNFQRELKAALVTLINKNELSIPEVTSVPSGYFDGIKNIQYKHYVNIREGIISHDELLIVARDLFKTYPKLIDITKDTYKLILIDEYQDTNTAVVEIFLTHFSRNNSRKQNIIGFFGDAMQAIYDDGIGNLNAYRNRIKEIQRKQNRRNPKNIIALANKLRTDGLIQEFKATNATDRIEQGTMLFFHSKTDSLDKVRDFLVKRHRWDFQNNESTKELNLTHNLIAGKAGFSTLMAIYNKDKIIGYRDRIKKYIKENNITTDFSGKTFGEVIAILKQGKTEQELTEVNPTDSMQKFIDSHLDLYRSALDYNYALFSRMYIDKDQLIDDKKQDSESRDGVSSKRDNLIRHLFNIERYITLYQGGKYNDFLRATDYQISSIEDKRKLKNNIESLTNVEEKTIEEVIDDAHEKDICLIDDRLNEFKEKNAYIYNRVKEVKYSELQKWYQYVEGMTPFSTQHKTKGLEFDNVLVVLDHGRWNNYNFQRLFLGNGTPTVLERTQKIFYVCCTRAKKNLAVFYNKPDDKVIAKAKEWFGDQSVIDIDSQQP